MIGSVLEARLSLDGQSVQCCLKVVRSRWREDGSFFYGCIFVGLTENKADQIAIFQIFNDAQYEKRAEEEANRREGQRTVRTSERHGNSICISVGNVQCAMRVGYRNRLPECVRHICSSCLCCISCTSSILYIQTC